MKFYSADPFKPCIICNKRGVDLHHVKSRGSGGTNDEWNLMPLAHVFHVELHTIGLNKFTLKYPVIAIWLKNNGWHFDEYLERYVRN